MNLLRARLLLGAFTAMVRDLIAQLNKALQGMSYSHYHRNDR